MTHHPNSLQPLGIHIVDDDAAVRQSLALLLAAKGHTVQAYPSGEAFLEQTDIQGGGGLILDLRMDGMSGLQVFDALRAAHSPLVTVFLSGHGDIAVAVEATKKGALSWLEKPCSEASLFQQLALALAEAERMRDQALLRQAARTAWDSLTPREQQVAALLRKGLPNKLIARALDNGVRAVETQRAKVYQKLGVSNPTELDWFLRDGGILVGDAAG